MPRPIYPELSELRPHYDVLPAPSPAAPPSAALMIRLRPPPPGTATATHAAAAQRPAQRPQSPQRLPHAVMHCPAHHHHSGCLMQSCIAQRPPPPELLPHAVMHCPAHLFDEELGCHKAGQTEGEVQVQVVEGTAGQRSLKSALVTLIRSGHDDRGSDR